MRRVALLAIALLLAQPLVAQAAPSTPPAQMTARILVRFADASARERVLARRGGVSRGPVGKTGFEVVELAAPSSASAIATLRADPGVIAVEADARVRLTFTPNDPYYQTDPYGANGQWGLRKTQVDRAWDVQRGSASVVVAIIDTGVDPSHPDLQGQLVAGPRYVSSPDASCPVDATNRDDNGHGTHVAGIVGAAGDNGIGVAGVAFGVRVMPIKALDCTGSGFLSDIARATTYAADNGARIVNVSLGASDQSAALQSAVTYALSKNVVIVAAAGNCGSESGTTRCPSLNSIDYPAAYPGVLAVGATDMNDQPAPFSTAASYIAVAAPGVGILSTFPTYRVQLNNDGFPTTGYAVLRGTSQAAPFVSGIAALLLSKDPSLTPDKIGQRLRTTADDVGLPGFDTKTGAGRVNAYRAITGAVLQYGAQYQVQPPAPKTLTFASNSTLRVAITNSSNFTWSAGGPTPVHVSTHWYTAAGDLAVWDGPRASLNGDVPPGGVATVDVPVMAPLPKGSYQLKVDVVQEGVTWFSSQGVSPLSLGIEVNGGYGATYQTDASTQIVIGAASTLVVTVLNTGTRVWPATGPTPVRLGTHLRDQTGKLVVWDGPRATLSADLAPGGATVLTVPLPQPAAPGSYNVELDLVQEGVLWFSSEGVVTKAVPASVTSGYAARYAIASPPPPMLPGERARVAAQVSNSGSFTWSASGATPVHLSTHLVDASGAIVVWDGARTQLAGDLAPGASTQATLLVDAPAPIGAYTVRVDLVREGLAWFSQQGVATADLPLVVLADRRASVAFTLTTVSRSAPTPLSVMVRNAGNALLSSEGGNPVNVSSHWIGADGAPLLWDAPRVALPRALLPGDQATVSLPLAVPPQGTAALIVDLVQEGMAWFGTGALAPVTVTP